MLRAIVLGLLSSVLAAACALVEQPPPAGTRLINAEVRNLSPHPLELMVQTFQTEGALPGAVRPSSVPPGSTARVAFYVPTAGEWSILIDPTTSMFRDAVDELMEPGCAMLFIETAGDGGVSAECK
jgi:hypothetical protein